MNMSVRGRRRSADASAPAPFERCIGWIGTTALAMGGSNQSLFLLAALFVGQGDIPGQGSAAVPLLIVGLLLSYAALPGWIELVMMSPHRVGGIAAACTEAFRPYGPILSTLTGVCYWWGWVPTCGLTAILSATALNQWFLPHVPVPLMACLLVCAFTAVNLMGIRWVTRLAVPIASCSALLAFVSALAPVWSGKVNWQHAVDFHLNTPFPGWFGGLTSLMAGLYLIGFAAPAFEAAACHVGETKNPEKNVPRAMKASALMAMVYFVVLPVIWLGTLGPEPLGQDLGQVLGPTFAPVFGALAKSAAIWFMMFNMFHGTVQPLAGAARTLSQLADDGLAPRVLGYRSRRDVPVVATLLTAALALVFLLIGDPIWLVAAANFNYLIGIAAPSVAVWLLRRNAPDAARSYRAPRFTIGLGLVSAAVWGAATILGFEQFGLPTVVFGLAMAYSGAALYAWRKWEDRRRAGLPGFAPTLHLRLTGAMLLVLALDGAGYILAVSQLPARQDVLKTALEDIFVMVAMLTITVGIVLPGVIAHSAEEVSKAARKLATGTLRDFSNAMHALARGDLDAAQAHIDIRRVHVRSNDELGEMAASFNALQGEVASAALCLGDARDGLRSARERLTQANRSLRQKVSEQHQLANELLAAKTTAEIANAAKNQFMARMSHELRTPLNGVLGPADLLLNLHLNGEQHALLTTIRDSGASLKTVIEQILDLAQIEADALCLQTEELDVASLTDRLADQYRREAQAKGLGFVYRKADGPIAQIRSDGGRIRQIVSNLLSNAVKFTNAGTVSLGVSVWMESAECARLVIEVKDTGPGIAADARDRIFASFAQADESSTRQHDGAGVGLFLARELATRLGGNLALKSEVGRGSEFALTVPVPLVSHDADACIAPHTERGALSGDGDVSSGSGALPESHALNKTADAQQITHAVPTRHAQTADAEPSILLAEDNPTNQTVALAALRRLGLQARVAANGDEAVQLFSAYSFDLVLMDCHMPGRDGISASAAIRTIESDSARARIPIIAVTADMTSANIMRCRAVGIDHIIAKPFNFAEFSSTLWKYLGTPANWHTAAVTSAVADTDLPDNDSAIERASIDELRQIDEDGSLGLVADVIATFQESAGRQVADLLHALAAQRWGEGARIAHTLKSSSAYVGALGFSRLLKDVEMACQSADPQGLDVLAQRVERAFSRLLPQLLEMVETGAENA
ncbi:signal transduction histidine kinase [Burkholderia sp. Ch1-1]|nr:signal transduction histidine kinase [Burkholderia sp. Ch1-1]